MSSVLDLKGVTVRRGTSTILDGVDEHRAVGGLVRQPEREQDGPGELEGQVHGTTVDVTQRTDERPVAGRRRAARRLGSCP
jgi:hypothetical protein